MHFVPRVSVVKISHWNQVSNALEWWSFIYLKKNRIKVESITTRYLYESVALYISLCANGVLKYISKWAIPRWFNEYSYGKDACTYHHPPPTHPPPPPLTPRCHPSYTYTPIHLLRTSTYISILFKLPPLTPPFYSSYLILIQIRHTLKQSFGQIYNNTYKCILYLDCPRRQYTEGFI